MICLGLLGLFAAIGSNIGGRKPTPPPPYEPAFDGELKIENL